MRVIEFQGVTRDHFPYDENMRVLDLLERLTEKVRQGEHSPIGIAIGFAELDAEGESNQAFCFAGFSGPELVGMMTLLQSWVVDIVGNEGMTVVDDLEDDDEP